MGRYARLVVPDVALHVVQRGNNRQDCFRHDNDRLVYLSLLKDSVTLRHCALHAYCLMTNHVHLLISPKDEKGCSLMMRDLGRDYAAYFNRRYERTGSLWERPFKSCLVDTADYVLACYRYIERNPVRAQMVDHPGAYPWSSYLANASVRDDPLLTPHAEYVALALDHVTLRSAYEGLVAEVDDDAFLADLREATHCGYPMIGDRLKSQLEKQGVRFERRKPGPRDESAASGENGSAQLALIE